jgi:hypothetical protein
MRQAEGAWRTKTDKDGQQYHLHRLNGAARPDLPPPRPPGPSTPRAEPDVLHRAYSGLLARLRLSQSHRDTLRQRGLSEEEIGRRGYRSLPVQGRARLARELRDRLGDALLTVPGFMTKPGEGGQPYVTVAGAAGLLIPVRDPAGRIVALLVRRDDAGDGGGKYSYLSSIKHGGPGPGAPHHVPLGVASPCPTVRLTEGALKADLAFALSGVPTIGCAGLGWRPALDALCELGGGTVRLAFDADAFDNPHVARALSDCYDAASDAGLAVELERWNKADGKGIDDLLAAGKTPEVLTAEASRAAISEVLAAATAGEPPPPPDPLERLLEVLASGGAPALFADKNLLEALARLAAADPAAFAARKATLKGQVSLRDLDTALKPFLREQARERPAVLLTEAGYRVEDGRTCRERGTPDGGTALVPLCNFVARITEVVTRDDGVEQTTRFAVEGRLADGRPLPRVTVDAAEFGRLEWVTPAWRGGAIVFAGLGTRDHLRVAVQMLSPESARRTVYLHTGWRQLGDTWHYLHAGGAIGADGPAAGVEVSLPDPLAGFALPEPPAAGPSLAAAVRASLALLGGLAPDRIAFPLLAAVYRAALGEAPGALDLSVFLAGPHGAGKSELAALAQQHYGAGLDARHLPGSWLSTGNALEGLAFAAKDALFVVDDYAPRGAAGDRQRCEREADRLLRAQGNRAGRQRMRPDGSLRPERPPRGLILSTGEDVPSGQSLRGRMLVLDVSPDDVPLVNLTPHQQAAAAGLYAQALAGFLRWLAPQYSDLCRRLPGERDALRARALAEVTTGSPRTPAIVADLALGLSLFLDFARAAGAVTDAERAEFKRRGWRALLDAASAQAEHVQAAEPTGLFLRLLAAALASSRAHVAGPDGAEPETPAAWGWRRETLHDGPVWKPLGRRVGWLDGEHLYLEPEASYAAAQELARDQGEAQPVSARTLHRRLKERGLLASTDSTRGVLTVRRTLEGKRRNVLQLRAGLLSAQEPDQPDQSATSAGDWTTYGGRVSAGDPTKPTSNPTNGQSNPTNPTSNPTSARGSGDKSNGPLVGLVGSATGGEGGPEHNGEESVNPPGCGDAWEPNE